MPFSCPFGQDTEMLAKRAAKRAKDSTGAKPPASTLRTPVAVQISPDASPRRNPRFSPQRGEQQQEEPLRVAPDMPPPSTMPPRGASPARAPTDEPTHTEEEDASLGAGGSVPATNVGGEGTTSSQLGTDHPSMDQEDIDMVIGEVSKDAEAETAKIVAEEATKPATGETGEGLAGEPGKATAEDAGKATAEEADEAAAEEAARAAAGEAAKKPAEEEVANDQPSSPAAPAPPKYLKVGDDLFVRLPGTADTRAPTEGYVFDDEALAAAGLQVVDEPSTSSSGPQEEQLLRAMGANF
nr:tol-Pal system protein TolA-like [Aegilops tauschii subsp. strangulata]